MRIIELFYKESESGKGINVDKIFLQEGHGIIGDKHGGKMGRHLTIIKESTREKLSKIDLIGLCMNRFKANIIICGDEDLLPGDRLKIGDAVIEISDVKKKCYDTCLVHSNKLYCPLKEVIFANVIQSGYLGIDSDIEIIKAANSK